MIVFNSMIFVVALLGSIYTLQTDSKYRATHLVPWGYAILAMGYIVFWAGLRSRGADTSAYVNEFIWMPDNVSAAFAYLFSGEKDTGYRFLEIVFKAVVSKDFHAWLMFVAMCTGIPIMITYRRYSLYYFYSIFLFITSTTVVWMFNGIRQMLAASILFGFGYLIEQKRFIKFLLVVFLCSLIHGTAWLMLPMYFFATGKPFGMKMTIFTIVVLSCAISIAPLMESMETVLQDTQYAQNIEQFKYDDGVHPLRVVFSAVPLLLSLIRLKQIQGMNIPYINMCVNMSVFTFGFYFIGMFTSGIMIGRIPIYFTMYNYILLPFLIKCIYPKERKLLYIFLTIGFLLFYYSLCKNIYYISDILGNYA